MVRLGDVGRDGNQDMAMGGTIFRIHLDIVLNTHRSLYIHEFEQMLGFLSWEKYLYML